MFALLPKRPDQALLSAQVPASIHYKMYLCPPHHTHTHKHTLITTTLRKDAPSVLGGTLQGFDFPLPVKQLLCPCFIWLLLLCWTTSFLFQRGPLTFWASSIQWVCQMLPLQSLFGMCKAQTVSTKQHLLLCFIIQHNDLTFARGDISFLFSFLSDCVLIITKKQGNPRMSLQCAKLWAYCEFCRYSCDVYVWNK